MKFSLDGKRHNFSELDLIVFLVDPVNPNEKETSSIIYP